MSLSAEQVVEELKAASRRSREGIDPEMPPALQGQEVFARAVGCSFEEADRVRQRIEPLFGSLSAPVMSGIVVGILYAQREFQNPEETA